MLRQMKNQSQLQQVCVCVCNILAEEPKCVRIYIIYDECNNLYTRKETQTSEVFRIRINFQTLSYRNHDPDLFRWSAVLFNEFNTLTKLNSDVLLVSDQNTISEHV